MKRESEPETYFSVIPTSHPDLFADERFRLIHRRFGPIGHDARHLVTLPDGSVLRIFIKAPRVKQLAIQPISLSGGLTQFGKLLSLFSTFAGQAAPILKGISAGIEVLAMFTSTKERGSPPLRLPADYH